MKKKICGFRLHYVDSDGKSRIKYFDTFEALLKFYSSR